MHKTPLMLALLTFLTLPVAVDARTIYLFECTGPESQLNLSPVSFNFQVAQPANAGVGTSGAGAGNLTLGALTIKFAAGTVGLTLFQDLVDGHVFSTCKLTAEKVGANEGSLYTWTFSRVLLSSFNVIASAGGGSVQGDYMQASFNYEKVTGSFNDLSVTLSQIPQNLQ